MGLYKERERKFLIPILTKGFHIPRSYSISISYIATLAFTDKLRTLMENYLKGPHFPWDPAFTAPTFL